MSTTITVSSNHDIKVGDKVITEITEDRWFFRFINAILRRKQFRRKVNIVASVSDNSLTVKS
jgi:hypothetical protein